jgi:hypothetical protein
VLIDCVSATTAVPRLRLQLQGRRCERPPHPKPKQHSPRSQGDVRRRIYQSRTFDTYSNEEILMILASRSSHAC